MIVAVSENFIHIGKLDQHADIFTQCLEIPGYNFLARSLSKTKSIRKQLRQFACYQ